jgi:DNA-binding GntR family transcriptional regulator
MTDFVVRDLWQSIYDGLRQMILSGEFAPGSRLLETELAQRVGTSRGPVRTALKELQRNGLVVQTPRRGTFVPALSDADTEEIFSLFEVLWPFALRRAVARMSQADLDRLAKLVPPPPSELGVDEALQTSLDFHRAVFEMAGHSRLLAIWNILTAQAQYRLLVTSTAERRLALGINPVPMIFEALARRDAEGAIEVSLIWTRRMHEVVADDDGASMYGSEPGGQASPRTTPKKTKAFGGSRRR